MKVSLLFRKIHKWLGLIIGIQVIFWVFGGLIMSSFPIDEVHGDHLRKEKETETLNISALKSPTELESLKHIDVVHFEFTQGFKGPQIRVKDAQGKLHLFDAITGEALNKVTENEARGIAQQRYVGNAPIASASLITEPSTEYRRALPAWKIEFNDDDATTFYIAESHGDLMSVRSTMWRIFDFVWMLHIMDYKDRTDFNHPLLIISALLALIISLSGAYLVVKTFRKKDFQFFKK